MRTLPVHLCVAMAVFATMAWGQEEGSDTGFASDAELAAKLKEVAENPAATPDPVVVPTITSSASAAVAANEPAPGTATTPTVIMTDEPAIEPGPEVHIGTGSVAWNAQLRETDANRALQEARARRNLYRDIARAGSPIPVQRTAAEFLAANPPVIQPVEEIPGSQGPRPLLEVRASGAPRMSEVPEFNSAPAPPPRQQALPSSRTKSNFLSFLKPKGKVEATDADFQNPYSAPDTYPGSEPAYAEGTAPPQSPEEQARMDAFIAEATVGAPPATNPNSGSSDADGNVLKKIFGKKSPPAPAPASTGPPTAPTFASNPPSSAPPISDAPDNPSGEPDLRIPSPPSVNGPEPQMPAPTASTPPPSTPTEPSRSIFRKEEPKPAIFRTE